MDRYTGPDDDGRAAEYAHFLLLMEREEWLQDQAAIAEYEKLDRSERGKGGRRRTTSREVARERRGTVRKHRPRLTTKQKPWRLSHHGYKES